MAGEVLLVEDDMAYAEGLSYWLTDVAEPAWQVTVAGSLSEALRWLQSHRPNVVLLDLNLPDSRELATFDRMWRACGDVPIVVITGLRGDTLEGNIIAGGAVWYLDKVWLAQHMEDFLTRFTTFFERRMPVEGC